MKRIFVLSLFILTSLLVRGQEPYFTQYYNSPLTLNPALAGTSFGDIRTTIIHRNSLNQFDQLQTSALAADMSIMENDRSLDYMGIGLHIMKDKAGTFENLRTMLTAAYHKSLGGKNSSYLAFGIQSGLDNSKLDYQSLTTQNQWTSSGFDGSITNGEGFRGESVSVVDVQAGALWYSFLPNKSTVLIGFSAFHLLPVNRSFFNQEYRLGQKYIAHASASFLIGTKMRALPNIAAIYQNGVTIVNPGVSFEYGMNRSTTVSFGTWLRNLDSFSIMVGMEYSQFSAALSYDLLISSINEASTQGGIEFSLGYRFTKKLKPRSYYKPNPSPRF